MEKILIVDSNPVLTRLACDILTFEGFAVVPVFDADGALQAVRSDDFSLAVVDHGLEQMGGLQLARVLREHRPNLPVILMATEPVESSEITLCVVKYALFPALIDGIYSCLKPLPSMGTGPVTTASL